jgi:hypothetical protein
MWRAGVRGVAGWRDMAIIVGRGGGVVEEGSLEELIVH